ncbi:MAG: hypothetical protein EOO88_35130 [Pedobacter sp.]|nr:MAG: hypothetical protein EOO88_35130 [Pedobacter sp.]
MLRRVFSLIGALIFSITAFGQVDSVLLSRIKLGDTDKETNLALAQLKEQKIDTIVIYYTQCIGSYLPIKLDSCSSSFTKYLIWKVKNQSYIRKFDGCYQYEENRISSLFLNSLYSRIEEFKGSKVLYPEYTEIKNGKKNKLRIMLDHSCHYMFEVHTRMGILKQDVDDFALSTKYIDDNKRQLNENYQNNQRSYLKKLVDAAEQLTKP